MAAARPRVGRRPGRGAAVEGVLHHGVEAGMTRRSAKLNSQTYWRPLLFSFESTIKPPAVPAAAPISAPATVWPVNKPIAAPPAAPMAPPDTARCCVLFMLLQPMATKPVSARATIVDFFISKSSVSSSAGVPRRAGGSGNWSGEAGDLASPSRIGDPTKFGNEYLPPSRFYCGHHKYTSFTSQVYHRNYYPLYFVRCGSCFENAQILRFRDSLHLFHRRGLAYRHGHAESRSSTHRIGCRDSAGHAGGM